MALPGMTYAGQVMTAPASIVNATPAVKAVWDAFLSGFFLGDISQIAACYDESSHLRVYSSMEGTKADYYGSQSVAEFYRNLFADIPGQGQLEVQVADVDEDAGQVFFAWRCPSGGVLAA